MLGATPVRKQDWTMTVAAVDADAPPVVPVYDKRNPRHTTRELMKYCLASRQVFKDPRALFVRRAK